MSATVTPTATRGRFVWHELLSTDTAAAKEFYKNVIGWGTTDMEGGPMPYTLWTSGDVPAGGLMTLPEQAKAMGAPPHWLAYVEVPDCDASVEQITKLGGRVLAPPMSVDMAGRFAVLQDPYGAVFGVITSKGPLQEENDPQPLDFSWHELTTDDLGGAVSFYEAIFGWTKQSEFDMGDMGIYHMFGRDRFTYGGMMKKPAPNMPSVWTHYIRVKDSADAAVERATKLGAKTMLGPMDVPGGDRVAILTDPQGAVFAVHSKSQA